MTVYFDCAATTPLVPEARHALLHFTDLEYGNAGSRTHEFGVAALKGVKIARSHVAALAGARADEVIFTSGATEANNLALLGLREYGEQAGRKHLITTAIEHKAVLEPVQALAETGFEVSLVHPGKDGRVRADAVLQELRPDTLVVSVMHANNETGALQPISAIAEGLAGHEAYFHVDAAQSFGKAFHELRETRIDLISASGHKLGAPKGVGALIARRGSRKVPLKPIMHGGGQERGLRPGTLPVALIAAFGAACQAAADNHTHREARCREVRQHLLDALLPLGAVVNGSSENSLTSIVNLSVPGLDSEAVMLVLKDLVAISNGSACTSTSYEPSHVLLAMGLPREQIDGAVRFSWSHLSVEPSWSAVAECLCRLR